MTFDEIKTVLEKTMPTKTFKHVLRVEETGIRLCRRHNLDEVPVRLGCLLHDAYKHLPLRQLQTAMGEDLTLLGEEGRHASNLLHGWVASRLSAKDFEVADQRALIAMRYHTTGHPSFCPEELAVYVADKSEPKRDYEGVAQVRLEAMQNLTRAAALISRRTLTHLLQKGSLIHPWSIAAYNTWRTA